MMSSSRRFMAIAVFSRVLRLHRFSIFSRGSVPVRGVHSGAEQADGASKDGSKLTYRLYYNPASYRDFFNSQTAQNRGEHEDNEPCQSSLTPSYWQQGNTHSVNSSRHLCGTENTLVDPVFNKSPETESQVAQCPIPPIVRLDTRAFLTCRPEYLHISLNLNQRPTSTPFEKSWALLQKVTVLKGSMKLSDICSIMWELSCVDKEKTALVRSDKRFAMLLRYSVENLQLFSVCQLLDILQAFLWLEMPAAHTVLSLFESELSQRADQMTFHQLLFAADLWRCIGKRVPQFLKSLYTLVPLYVGQIRTPELVQLLYIIGEGRHCPTHLIQPIEQLLLRHLHELQPEEVGAVCLGLFKSQTSFSEGAVIQIVDKAHSFVSKMSNFALVNVMKYMRFSRLSHKEWLEAVGKEVPKRADTMGIEGLMHVSLACSALHYRNDSLLQGIAEKVPSLVPHSRSKDSCKLLWAFGTLGFFPINSPNFYPSLTEGLRKCKAEFQRYPEHLLTGLLGLAFVSTFPEDLIALALSPEFVNFALKTTKLELNRDFYTLDGAVELEVPNWTGPRLSSELKKEFSDMMWKFAESEVCQKREIVEAEMCLKDLLGGEEFVCKRMILPHTRSIDLEVHLDSKGQPMPVMLTCSKIPEKSLSENHSLDWWDKLNIGVNITEDLMAQLENTKKKKTAPKVEKSSIQRVELDKGEKMFDTGLVLTNEHTEMLTKRTPHNNDNGPVKLAIQLCHRDHYCYNSNQLLGLHRMKRRHLKLAGYKVIELHHQEWFPMLRKSRAEKMAYLRGKVFNQ